MKKSEMDFGELIDFYIERSGRTLAATARMLGYSRSMLTKWKTRKNISFNTLQKLCDLVGVSDEERQELIILAGFKLESLVTKRLIPLADISRIIGDLESLSQLDISREEVEAVIQSSVEPTYLRLALLHAYILDGYHNQELFVSLVTDPSPEVCRRMLRYVYKNPNPDNEIVFDGKYLQELINNPEYEVASTAIQAARHLVTKGHLPLKFLTVAKTHPYWLVRRIAIQRIAKVDTPEILELLYEFRTTSYHISQQTIRDFVKKHFLDGNFDAQQKEMAIDLIKHLMEAKKVSDISRRKNEKLLAILREDSKF